MPYALDTPRGPGTEWAVAGERAIDTMHLTAAKAESPGVRLSAAPPACSRWQEAILELRVARNSSVLQHHNLVDSYPGTILREQRELSTEYGAVREFMQDAPIHKYLRGDAALPQGEGAIPGFRF